MKKSYTYDAYGNTTASADVFENHHAYTGAYMDGETGLYYLSSRYYDPKTGSFTSADSYRGESEGYWQLYAYCEGDPVNGTDLSGHVVTVCFSSASIPAPTAWMNYASYVGRLPYFPDAFVVYPRGYRWNRVIEKRVRYAKPRPIVNYRYGGTIRTDPKTGFRVDWEKDGGVHVQKDTNKGKKFKPEKYAVNRKGQPIKPIPRNIKKIIESAKFQKWIKSAWRHVDNNRILAKLYDKKYKEWLKSAKTEYRISYVMKV